MGLFLIVIYCITIIITINNIIVIQYIEFLILYDHQPFQNVLIQLHQLKGYLHASSI